MFCERDEIDFFKWKPNSLLTCLTSPKKDGMSLDPRNKQLEDKENISNNLGMISLLYLYTSTPPLAYGTQAPKVAETVLRAYSFNKKPENSKHKEYLGRKTELLHWEKKDGPFPFEEIHGNFITSELRMMVKTFLTKYHINIDSTANKTMEFAMNTNSDVLTKGRQSYCSITELSRTAPEAYREMYEFFISNGAPGTMTCLEWIQHFFIMMDKEEITIKKRVVSMSYKRKYNRKEKMYERIGQKVTRLIEEKIVGNAKVRDCVLNLAVRFASYLKNKERNKLERRAIASANMIMRMFLAIVEEFHLNLSGKVEGSTIAIGGEEKKAKIMINLNSGTLNTGPAEYTAQGTEDATKWNECLAPQAFAAMHTYLFDDYLRDELGLPKVNENGKVLSRIMVACNFLMTFKEVQLGPGVLAQNESGGYRRIEWRGSDAHMMGDQTLNWYKRINPYVSSDRKHVRAAPGMLMGMLNGASTILGLLATCHRMDKDKMSVVTLRSSDDSMTKYMANRASDLSDCVTIHTMNLALIGINTSKSKSLFFPEGFGEFTSWFQDEKFIAQYGTETSSIRPQGKNPPDDFYSIAKSTAISLSTLGINHIGAEAKLRLGIDGVRRLWRINKDYLKRPNVSAEVLLLSDGGRSPWNNTNCHLQEIPLKDRKAVSEEEKQYLWRCLNPDNPFSEDPSEEMTYSKEFGALVLDEIETPRTAFHYVKRSNRTRAAPTSDAKARRERKYGEACEILKSVDPTIMLSFPSSNVPISHHMIGILESEASLLDLDESEKELCDKAIKVLRGENADDDEENFLSDLMEADSD